MVGPHIIMDLIMCKSHSGCTGFEGMKRSWGQLRLGTLRDQERSLVKVQPQWQMKAED